MSHYSTYSPLFTGPMTSPDTGVKITDYENFAHIREEVHPEWAFSPVIDWKAENPDSYPKEQYAYLYGFTYPDESLSQYDEYDTFHLNKASPGSQLFTNLWYAVAMTCEPFKVLMYEGSSSFPRMNQLAMAETDLSVKRLDCEPGRIEIVNVPLTDSEEEVVDTLEWNYETYEEERFLGGINY